MSYLRFAYIAEYLIAVIAVFVLWSQVGGQGHLDLMPWYVKLALGAGAAFAVVKATTAAISEEKAWNSGTLKWCGILLGLLICCGLASYYCHLYLEDEDDQQNDSGSIGWTMPVKRPVVQCAALQWRFEQSLSNAIPESFENRGRAVDPGFRLHAIAADQRAY